MTSTAPAASEAVAAMPARRGFRVWRTRAALVLGTLAACFAMLEVGLRVTGRYRKDGPLFGWYEQGGLSYRLQPNVDCLVEGYNPYTIHTDAQGHRVRSRDTHLPGDNPYYLMVGASDVFGEGLDFDQCFVGVAASHLRADGIDVVNLGVPGHHLLEQQALLTEFFAANAHKPVAVVVFLNHFMVADFADTQQKVLVAMGYTFNREGPWRRVAARTVLSNLSAAYCYFRDTLPAFGRSWSKPKPPDYETIYRDFSVQNPFRRPEVLGRFEAALQDMVASIRAAGARPLIVYSPTYHDFRVEQLAAEGQLDRSRFDTTFYPRIVEQFCKAHAIDLLNFRPVLQQLADAKRTLNLENNPHYNAPVSRLLGEALYGWLTFLLPGSKK